MSQYTHKKPPNDSLATCYPSNQRLCCVGCMRFRRGRPLDTDIRQFVVIDASVVTKVGQPCPMFEGRPTARPFCEPERIEEELPCQ